jgi:3-oxoacyl-[acyl-carrier protein] reductase
MSDAGEAVVGVEVGGVMVETSGAHRFGGRIAAVTGAASGIGMAVAERFIAEGATVYCLDVSAERLAQRWTGVDRAVAMAVDVGDSASVNAAFDRIEAEHGRLDALVTAAGVSDSPSRMAGAVGHASAELDTIDDESWDFVIRINLTGTFYCVRAAVPLMRRVGPRGGAVVTISSVGALAPYPLPTAYPSS